MAYMRGHAETEKDEPSEQIIFNSSFLQGATFDPKNDMVTISFKSGHTSIHQDFAQSDWDAFKLAKSHGSYYARIVKKNYPAFALHETLKVSDFEKAKKESGSSWRLRANTNKTATR